jgi:hypothetical protein
MATVTFDHVTKKYASDPTKRPMTVQVTYLLGTYGQQYNLRARRRSS